MSTVASHATSARAASVSAGASGFLSGVALAVYGLVEGNATDVITGASAAVASLGAGVFGNVSTLKHVINAFEKDGGNGGTSPALASLPDPAEAKTFVLDVLKERLG